MEPSGGAVASRGVLSGAVAEEAGVYEVSAPEVAGIDSKGDEGEALAALYAATVPSAVRLAYLLTGDRMFAEDAVQEAFVRVASRLTRVRDPDRVGAYLRRAVVNE